MEEMKIEEKKVFSSPEDKIEILVEMIDPNYEFS
jgi:hypothetical protein